MSYQDNRPIERKKFHYETEKRLANILRNSTKNERSKLYNTLYDELFSIVDDHPLLLKKNDRISNVARARKSIKLISSYLNKKVNFVEIGPGDCTLSIEVSKFVKNVYSVDVSKELTKRSDLPRNLFVIISNGVDIDLPSNSIDLVYSNQLMEHLHPDDARDQLKAIYRILKPGGRYICITPNRITGPHDVSRYFDKVSTGFHLKEYTNSDLYSQFKESGFLKIKSYLGKQGVYIPFSIKFKIFIEDILNRTPECSFLRKMLLIRILLRIIIVSVK